jgi:hypothetical protein
MKDDVPGERNTLAWVRHHVFVSRNRPPMPVTFAAVVTALLLLAVGASLAAAAHPLLAPLVLAVAAGAGRLTIPSLPFRRLLWGGLVFIAFLTVPAGLLTHGLLSGSTSFAMRDLPDASLADRINAHAPTDSVAFQNGYLVSFPRTDSLTTTVAYREDGTLQWAASLPRSANVHHLDQLTVSPLLWRVRVDLYAHGSGPGWLYIWRWGHAQRLHVLDEEGG